MIVIQDVYNVLYSIQAVVITDEMAKHLDKKRIKYFKSMFFSLDNRRLLPVAISMFQKYREICTDELKLHQMTAAADVKEKKVYTLFITILHDSACEVFIIILHAFIFRFQLKFLGRVLLRRKLLTKPDYIKLFGIDQTLEEQNVQVSQVTIKSVHAVHYDM